MENIQIKQFILIFDNKQKEITRHTNIEDVKSVYLNKKVRLSNGKLGFCVDVHEKTNT